MSIKIRIKPAAPIVTPTAPLETPQQKLPRAKSTELAAPVTLGEVQRILRKKTTAENKTKYGLLLSAINTVTKAVGQCSPDDVAANPQKLRAQLDGISPAMVCLSASSWSSARSRVLTALKTANVLVMESRRTSPLTPPWRALRDLLPKSGGARPSLSRFMSFCTDFEYNPTDVFDGITDRFLEVLENESLRGDPRTIHRKAVRTWNWAVGAVPGWPETRLVEPDVRDYGYVFSPDFFSCGFQTSLEPHLQYLRDPPEDDDKAPFKGVKETTLVGRRFSFLQIASVLVRKGVPSESLNSIEDLPSVDNMNRLCEFYEDRFKAAYSTQLCTLLSILRGVAKHRLKDEALYKRIGKRIAKLLNKGGKRRGITKKNKNRLLQFRDNQKIRHFLTLPLALISRATKKIDDKVEAARIFRNAIAIEIEIFCPIRLTNLADLDFSKNFISYKVGKTSLYHLYVPEDKVKNEQEIRMALPPQTCALIQLYMKDYRRFLLGVDYQNASSTSLFPKENGTPMTGKTLSYSICQVIKNEIGVSFNMHLFRHLACYLYLRQNPHGFETMRKVLGHKQLSTTINFYAEMEQSEAFAQFDETILQLRHGFAPKPAKRNPVKIVKKSVSDHEVPLLFNLTFEGSSDVL